MIAKVIADVNRPSNRSAYPMADFFYEDPVESRKRKDLEMFSAFSALVQNIDAKTEP